MGVKNNTYVADIKAGLVVFLIALPLSLGISLASGAPSTAGLVAAILGGILGAYLGGSYVTINGPAAGLIVVVLSAIQSLAPGDPMTGFRRMLACVVVVGVLQILSGLFKAGRFVSIFPVSVVHGMLSAIGLIIMIKQIHVFFGVKFAGTIVDSIMQIPKTILNPDPESAWIGLISVMILLVYPQIKMKFTKFIPAPLVVVTVGVLLSSVFLNASHVHIPTNFAEFYVAPLFDVISSRESIFAILSLYFVASLESVLSASAVDKLDPMQRESDFDRELWSKGLVNIACGMLGGLPIIAEIVRSSASISQGAKTPLANFSHGVFILVFLLLCPQILNLIPLSALAAILILVGYRLAQPAQFKNMYNLGMGSFLSFVATIAVTLLEDLLLGILAGIVVKFIVSCFQGASLKSLLKPEYQVKNEGDKAILEFQGSLIFFSALKQRKILNDLASYKVIEINLANISYIDPTSLSIFSRESERMEKAGAKVTIDIPEKFSKLYGHVKGHS